MDTIWADYGMGSVSAEAGALTAKQPGEGTLKDRRQRSQETEALEAWKTYVQAAEEASQRWA